MRSTQSTTANPGNESNPSSGSAASYALDANGQGLNPEPEGRSSANAPTEQEDRLESRPDLLVYQVNAPVLYKRDPVFIRLGPELIGQYQEWAESNEAAGPKPKAMTGWLSIIPSEPSSCAYLFEELRELGLQGGGMYRNTLSGKLPLASLPDAARLNALRSLRVRRARTGAGLKTNEAVEAHQISALAELDLDGTGVDIGVISDSFNRLGGWRKDVATGDLPGAENPDGRMWEVKVLRDDDSESATDEGRAMLQLIHDIAPGARLMFHSAFNNPGAGSGTLASAAEALIQAGADIVVDDIFFFNDPIYQAGFASRTIAEGIGQGVLYYTAAGNSGLEGFEYDFATTEDVLVRIPGSPRENLTVLDFDPGEGTDSRLRIQWNEMDPIWISLHWTQPFYSVSPESGGATTDLDFYLVPAGSNEWAAGGGDSNAPMGDPYEGLYFEPDQNAAIEYDILVDYYSGPMPERVALIIHKGARFQDIYGERRGTVVGHQASLGGVAVGAVSLQDTPAYGQSPPVMDENSSSAIVTWHFDESGQRLANPVRMELPQIAAVHTVATSMDFPFDVFTGTSAAAPNLGASAALLRQAFPHATPDEINQALFATAQEMEEGSVPFRNGYGFARPFLAVKKMGLQAPPLVFQNTLPNLLSGNLPSKTILFPRVHVQGETGLSWNNVQVAVLSRDDFSSSEGLKLELSAEENSSLRREGDLIFFEDLPVAEIELNANAGEWAMRLTENASVEILNCLLRRVQYEIQEPMPSGVSRNFNVEIRLTDAMVFTQSVTLTLAAQTLESWRREHFDAGELADPDLEAPLWGDAGDPDGDGLPNFLEYVFLLSPHRPNAPAEYLKPYWIALLHSDNDYLDVEIDVLKDREDVEIWAEVSSDLVHWSRSEIETLVRPSPQGSRFRKLIFADRFQGAGDNRTNRFIRVRAAYREPAE